MEIYRDYYSELEKKNNLEFTKIIEYKNTDENSKTYNIRENELKKTIEDSNFIDNSISEIEKESENRIKIDYEYQQIVSKLNRNEEGKSNLFYPILIGFIFLFFIIKNLIDN